MVHTSPSTPFFSGCPHTACGPGSRRALRATGAFRAIVGSTARHILHAVQMPDKDFFAVGLLQSVPAGNQGVKALLVQGHTNQRMVDFLHDGVGVLKAVNGHGGAAAEFQGQLDAVGLHLLHHFPQDGHGVSLDIIQRGVNGQVHRRDHHDHLAV